jgi:hypothetical protein
MEEFFRKEVQNYDFEFQERDWIELKRELDKVEQPGYMIPWKYIVLGLVLCAFIISGSIVYISDYEPLKPQYLTSNLANNSDKDHFSTLLLDNNALKNLSHNYEDTHQVAIGTSTIVNDAVHSTSDFERYERVNEQDGLISLTVDRQKSERKILGNVGMRGGSGQERERVEVVPGSLFSIVPYTEIGGEELPIPTRFEPEIKSDLELIQTEELVRQVRNKNRGLIIGFNISPDFSAVGFSNFKGAGRRIGATIEYFFSAKVGVNSGLILVNNEYSAEGSEYKPSKKGFWTRGIVPAEAVGACKILDIPLNVRYNAGLWKRHKLFIGGGISTYIMIDEKYYFRYNQDNPDLVKYWKSKSASSHIFGIINFSAGYEYSLNNHWSVQVEPFVKLPITEIGWGQLNLYSTGLNFAFRYRIKGN